MKRDGSSKSNESEIGQLNMVIGRATLMNRIMADDLATPNLEQTDDVRLNLHSEHLNRLRLKRTAVKYSESL